MQLDHKYTFSYRVLSLENSICTEHSEHTVASKFPAKTISNIRLCLPIQAYQTIVQTYLKELVETDGHPVAQDPLHHSL